MNKKLTGRTLSIILSAAMVFSTAAPSSVYAAEVENPAAAKAQEAPAAEVPAEEAEVQAEAAEETEVQAEAAEAPAEEAEVQAEAAEAPAEEAEAPAETEVPTEEETPAEETEELEAAGDDGGEAAAAPTEEMKSVSIGGVTYYYANAAEDDNDTIYTATVTSRAGSQTYEFTQSSLTELGSTDYFFTTLNAAGLSGTLYGYGTGTASSYKEVYEGKVTSLDDPAYDAVSSATGFSSYHAKDISGTVTYDYDDEGNKTAITGLELGNTLKTVDAASYVEASILKDAGEELTEDQYTTLDITLKKDPMTAPSDGTAEVKLSSASWTTSRYGDGEFVIIPDSTVEGYVWSAYWDKVYGATVSDGTTTVGAVHWIDLYGEDSTSGAHYNKIELALNNGTSVGANTADVARYAAFYDTNTGNVKAGTYTITIYADGYENLTAEVTIPAVSMSSATIGGVSYYYADTTGADAAAVYTAAVRSRAGSTVYNFTKDDLTQIGDTNIYYTTLPGVTPLEGTLYAFTDGTASSYKEVYAGLDVSTDSDAAYDAVSSATTYTSFHAGDIASAVTFGTDADGNKVINGVTLGRGYKTIAAADYVTACLLKAAGQELTEDQEAAAALTLKQNPTEAPADSTAKAAPVAAAAAWTTSSYGIGEFVINPDETAAGYKWNEYWDNTYAVTISDGTTTVGALPWIDVYGEKCTSGFHYNKLEIALNNGTSVGKNEATVSRFAAFFDENNELKDGKYTITVYSDGYEPMTAEVWVGPQPQTITAKDISGYVGNTAVLNAAAQTALTYKSSNTKVATVDKNGKVTLVGYGTAKITINAAASDEYQAATAEVTVKATCKTPVVSAANDAKGVKISWKAIAGAAKYVVYRKNGTKWSAVGTTASTSLVDTKVTSGTSYTYTVKCLTAAGAAASKYDTTGKTIKYLANIAASVSNSAKGVVLTWTKVTGASGYYVYRKTGTGSWSKLDTLKSTVVTYTDTKAANGTDYSYAVKAYSGSVSGTYTAVNDCFVSTPAISSLTNSASKKMTVKWAKNSQATGYQIRYSTAKNMSGAVTVTIRDGSTVSQVISGLTKSKTYYVQLRTYKTSSKVNYWSAWSAAKTVKISK